jgi:hypothetical protein
VGSNAAFVFAFMRDSGYSVWVFRQRKLESWAPGLRSISYLFLRPEHVTRLRDNGILGDR